MTIYRGPGGTGSATSDADTNLYQQFLEQSLAARDAALAAQTAAELAETNAENAETNAETAETNAETAATNAASSASAAATSASNASSSASAAASSASSASTSATNAANSATAAAASDTNAANSASTATTQASNASSSATAAASSASSAATSATNAASSASSASTSATNAANSATSASNSASSAATSATNAANSATSASNSATAAAASASEAAGYAASINPADLVHISGTETITGAKTFSTNPTLSAGTANGVAYLNGSKVLTTGSALTFDGTNLGIGTSSPQSPLQVVGTVRLGAGPSDATNATLAAYSDGTGISIEAFQGNNTGVKRNIWLAAYGGNVGIGTSSPPSYGTRKVVALDGAGGSVLDFNVASTRTATIVAETNDLQVGTMVSGPLRFLTNGSERARIDSSGNVLIGDTSAAGSGLTLGNGKDLYLKATGYNTWKQVNYQGGLYWNNGSDRVVIDSSGNFAIPQSPGKYTVDTSGGATSIANNGTVDFANASGMLIVNNHSSGSVTIYLCGAGTTGVVSTLGSQVGTFSYVAGIAGYRWTNTYGSTATFGFFFVRTRQTA